MEEPQEERFSGSDQEGGGEEDDGEPADRRALHLAEEEKHQDVQRDRGGQVRGIHTKQVGRALVKLMFHLRRRWCTCKNCTRVVEK